MEQEPLQLEDDFEWSSLPLYYKERLGLLSIIKNECAWTVIAVTQLRALLPQFMRRGGLQPKGKLHETAYLDGLRGLAAFFVANYHAFLENQQPWIMRQPILRLTFSGRAMVDVFFLISGYVLSYQLLQYIREKRAEDILDRLASALFRRYLRLYCPCAIALFCAVIAQQLRWIPGLPENQTLQQQLRDWFFYVAAFVNPFYHVVGEWQPGVFGSRYLDQLWSIPVEFRGSIIVFTFCTLSCKLVTRTRMALCWVIILICYWWNTIYVSLFLMGVFVADLSFTIHPERLQLSQGPTQTTVEKLSIFNTESVSIRILYSVTFFLSLFLLGQPSSGRQMAPWPWPLLDSLIPAHLNNSPEAEHFWISIGAFLLVLSLECYPTLQKPLLWSFPQYLGRISFGIYVMHLLILWSLYNQVIFPLQFQYLGIGRWQSLPGIILYYFMIMWLGELFSRIDSKIVSLGRRLRDNCFSW